MPNIKRPYNRTGLWLSAELNERGVMLSDFAGMVGTTPQNLTLLMRGDAYSKDAMERWEQRFRDALDAIPIV